MLNSLIFILISSVLVNNYVLNNSLGICPFLGVSKKINQALGMGIAVTVVMVIASAATWPIQYFLLDAFGLGYMQTIVFILVIASLVQMIEIFLKKMIPSLHKGLGVYLPLITTNCAVLAIAQANIAEKYGFIEAVVSGLACGLGFMLAMLLFSGIRQRIDETAIPKPFRGVVCTLIAASFLALAFIGFNGIADTLKEVLK